jgi:DNA-directed RNA polymerase specialized sigma subunit
VSGERFDPDKDAARLLAIARSVARAHLLRYPATLRDGWDVDDMTSEAVYYGLTALTRWSPHGGASWQNFVRPRMRGALIDEMRRRGSLTRTELARGMTVDELPEHRQKAVTLDGGDDDDYAWREREVVVRRYLLDETLVRIGDRLGVTDVQVCHIRTAAFAKIRRWAKTRGVAWW